MAVGDKSAFLQFGASTKVAAVDTAGVTVTFSTGATGLPSTAVRMQNLGTATLWFAQGSNATTSASVTSAGIMIAPATQIGCLQVIRGNGSTTAVVFAVGATQTGSILFTPGEGIL